MKTKALLLTAALAAAGVATSMAQVFSVNAVGYVNKALLPGFNLVSNPLLAADNTVGTLFKNMSGGVAVGTRIFVFKNGGYIGLEWEPLDEAFIPADAAAEVIAPGNGVFVYVPAAKTLTFVGEVRQGNLQNAIPQGFSIKANQVPQAGRPDQMGLGGAAGDRFFRFNSATQGYQGWEFEPLDNAWIPEPGLPTIEVGEAFFFFRSGAATSWNRSFTVNN